MLLIQERGRLVQRKVCDSLCRMIQILSAVTPVLVSALIGALVAWHASQRSALLANVTQERAAWRERIRKFACELQEAVRSGDEGGIQRLRMQFRLSLNPWDDRDRELVALLGVLVRHALDREETLERVSVRLELLLKHDWERAKAEATWFASHRLGTPRRRAAVPRAGVEALARFRKARPLEADFDEMLAR